MTLAGAPEQPLTTIRAAMQTALVVLFALPTGACRDDPLADQAAESLRRVFDAPHPELGGPFGGLAMGMSVKEASEAAPELAKGFAVLEDYPVLQFGYHVAAETGRVASARVVVPGTRLDLEEVLTEQWGEPIVGEELGKRRVYWFHPAARLRATVWKGYGRHRQVVLEPLLPLEALFETDPDDPLRLGFDHPRRRLLGAKLRAVSRYYGDYRSPSEATKAVDGKFLQLAPTEYALALTRLHLETKDRKVARVRFEVDYAAVESAKEEIRGHLVERFGEPARAADDDMRWEGPLLVEAKADDAVGSWTLTITQAPG